MTSVATRTGILVGEMRALAGPRNMSRVAGRTRNNGCRRIVQKVMEMPIELGALEDIGVAANARVLGPRLSRCS